MDIMTKKDSVEIKKLFTVENCRINHICGCYVDHDKNKVMSFNESFFSLDTEEQYKYFELFRKVLSGTTGKNALTMSFPNEAEAEGGTQDFLMKLRKSELKDDVLVQDYFDQVINTYSGEDNYLILLIQERYDIPKKTKDGLELEDASEEVYSHILSCVCPVSLTKPGLSYNATSQAFVNRQQDWVVGAPEFGFLFPAFIERTVDIHNVLFYTKNADDHHADFVDNVLGSSRVLTTVSGQKELFHQLIEDTLGDACDYQSVCNIEETLQEKIDQKKDSPEPYVMTRQDVAQVFSESGVPQEQLEKFDQVYDMVVPKETPIVAANVVNSKSVEVKGANIIIKVKPEYAHLLETKEIEGRKCLVIALEDEIEVNGIRVNSSSVEENEAAASEEKESL